MSPDLKSLVSKLNPVTRSVLEAAAGLCLSRTHYNVELEHILIKMLDGTGADAYLIFRHFDIDTSRMTKDITAGLDKLKTGNGRTPALSPQVVRALTDAWTLGSIDDGATAVRSGHVVLALVANEDLFRECHEISPEFVKLSAEELRKNLHAITAKSREEALPSQPQGTSAEPGKGARPAGGKTPNLDLYTIHLTENARLGKLDPVLARDTEIRQIVDILTRRRQNNPILVGEAGVGKTAVVEGLAIRIANGDVPPPLRNVSLRTLDLALLQAGAGVKGEFENRLKALIQEVKSSAVPVILFIDEAHTMIGAGGQAGQNDAANLLKPALARGELRTIAATTWSEYKKYFEKDPALTRRFQVVKIDEPVEESCRRMLRGVIPVLEKHHQVRILDEGLDSAVRLSHRYLPDRQLPDKAVSVLDTACARLSLGQNSVPPALEEAGRILDDIAVQTRVLDREVNLGSDHGRRLAELAASKLEWEGRKKELEERWQKEFDLVRRIREVREQLERGPDPPGAQAESASGASEQPALSAEELRARMNALTGELDQLQGEHPMVRVSVDSQVVSEVISAWTGIPVGKMLTDEVSTVLSLHEHLNKRIIGQNPALEAISRRIRTAKALLDDPGKPVGVFLLVGPSGVGKTETALALADLLYGGERNLITINMSEFQEAHTVSTLKGSPPGYVGYGEGGVLTEAVRRRPYSVVLLDEVEKAHPDVLELFFQVFDKGRMEDGEGREIDFRNTIILLTSNAATDTLVQHCSGGEDLPPTGELVGAMKPELNRTFKPAFLGRLVIIPYLPLRDDSLKTIVRLKLGKIQRRFAESHKVALNYSDAVVTTVAARCTEVESGARNIDNILTNTVLPDLSQQILNRIVGRQPLNSIRIDVDSDGRFVYE
ncbi:MAG: type VI secretion system ATPase TssH [Bryobacterales bacterium]|nr:type VI secretion system ATPase TssH [Bryobacterales bacterium]